MQILVKLKIKLQLSLFKITEIIFPPIFSRCHGYRHVNCQCSINSTTTKVDKKPNSIKVNVSPIRKSSTVFLRLFLGGFLFARSFSVVFHLDLLIMCFQKKTMNFWRILYNAHEFPWTILQNIGIRLHIEEMRDWFYNVCFKLQSTIVFCFYKTDLFM